MKTFIVQLNLPTGQPVVKISAEDAAISDDTLTFTVKGEDVAQFNRVALAGWWRDTAVVK